MKTIAKIAVAVSAVVVAVAIALPVFAGDNQKSKEEKVKLEDCPAAVQQAIKDAAAGGQIVEVEKEIKKDGSVVYEAEVKKADGKVIEVKVSADGKVIKMEEEDDDDNDADDDADDEADDSK